MMQTNLVIPTVLAVFVIIALVAMARRSRRPRRLLLSPLTQEARDRYAARWDRIEARFLEAPQDAVREADALVLALLGEVDHPLAEGKLSKGMQTARREAAKGGTEGLRVAMLHYRTVIEEMARGQEDSASMREGRRETA